MRIGMPRERKVYEHRVAMTPAGVREAVTLGHEVLVEAGAGAAIGFRDADYATAGADVIASPADVFAASEIIVKVKEPQPDECAMLRSGQVLFTYLHLAADRQTTQLLLASRCTAIAYETVTDARGGLPLLAPMSEIAGRMAAQVGAHCLENPQGGAGILMSGVSGVRPANVVVLGGGVVGANAARIARGMGADVTVLDRSVERLRELDQLYGPSIRTIFSSLEAIEENVMRCDLAVGAALIPGAAAPRLVSKKMLPGMKRGSVLVDVSIDQGGCFETSRPTTHAEPTYTVEGVIHYCVSNMPGGVARTSTIALTNATLPYLLRIASHGWRSALAADRHLTDGLNIHDGAVTCGAVAAAHGMQAILASDAIGIS